MSPRPTEQGRCFRCEEQNLKRPNLQLRLPEAQRLGLPFVSMTGERGDFVILDDPMSVDDALSDTKRDAINPTFRESLPTRLNNPKRSAIIVIMQRLHEDDKR